MPDLLGVHRGRPTEALAAGAGGGQALVSALAIHLHVPWVIPGALVDTFLLAYPSKRHRSAWIGICVHSAQTVVLGLGVLARFRRAGAGGCDG